MKKTIATLFATATITAGLLASAGVAPASAAPTAVYPGTVRTKTHSVAPKAVSPGNGARVCGEVFLKGTNQDVSSGSITITVKKTGGAVVASQTLPYSGGTACFTTGSLSKGSYKVRVEYTPASATVFKASKDSKHFTVRSKRKR